MTIQSFLVFYFVAIPVPATVVPVAVGAVLFVIIVVVIKCVKIRRLTRQDDGSQYPLLVETDDDEMIDLTEGDTPTAETTA